MGKDMVYSKTDKFLFMYDIKGKQLFKGIFSLIFFDTFPFKGGEETDWVLGRPYPSATPSDKGCFAENSYAAHRDLFLILVIQGSNNNHLSLDINSCKISASKMLTTTVTVVVVSSKYPQGYELVTSLNFSLYQTLYSYPLGIFRPDSPENWQKNINFQKKVQF